MLLIFCMNNTNFELLQKFLLVSMSPGFLSTPLTYALAKVLFYEYTRIPVIILFLLLIQLYIKL